jgi:hypothetical protein
VRSSRELDEGLGGRLLRAQSNDIRAMAGAAQREHTVNCSSTESSDPFVEPRRWVYPVAVARFSLWRTRFRLQLSVGVWCVDREIHP